MTDVDTSAARDATRRPDLLEFPPECRCRQTRSTSPPGGSIQQRHMLETSLALLQCARDSERARMPKCTSANRLGLPACRRAFSLRWTSDARCRRHTTWRDGLAHLPIGGTRGSVFGSPRPTAAQRVQGGLAPLADPVLLTIRGAEAEQNRLPLGVIHQRWMSGRRAVCPGGLMGNFRDACD
jgi:hypothetical protein